MIQTEPDPNRYVRQIRNVVVGIALATVMALIGVAGYLVAHHEGSVCRPSQSQPYC